MSPVTHVTINGRKTTTKLKRTGTSQNHCPPILIPLKQHFDIIYDADK